MEARRQDCAKLSLAKRRARARKRSDGAVMFVVVTTLGLLAVMGAYALSSTTEDIRASSNYRRSVQAQNTTEMAAVATADYVTFANADNIVNARMLNPSTDLSASENNCLSAQKNQAGVRGTIRAKSCVRITSNELKKNWGDREVFTAQSFGDGDLRGDVIIELTNPTQAPPPPGYDINLRLKFAMVSVSTYGIIQINGVSTPAQPYNGDSMQVGRGRFIIGPLNQ
ncbi:hypothetical protein AKJ09_06081 [Labilithrix luteola]|uniref:Uncharacterized protein n=1 Tax=Labilithrix luteola TaxID=1391654 RepID=A0A0K1Q110_9BACT|nr:hypothetical protein [Labilithrix luteola]AKU99417.1 hypothetical protein AKJ09_06081 [Labilithrix luteola]